MSRTMINTRESPEIYDDDGSMIDDGFRDNQIEDLSVLVKSRSGIGTKDPRDIIFAHIGMVFRDKDIYRTCPEFAVDYRSPVIAVYNTFTRAVVGSPCSLEIADYVHQIYPQDRLPGLSSWAPDVCTILLLPKYNSVGL